MKRTVILILCFILLVPAAALAKKDKDLMGTYTVTGFNPGVPTSGTPSYTGDLTVSQTGGAYELVWKLNGKETRKGVGIYTDGVFSVGFDDGVASYRVEKKALRGAWAPKSGGVFGFEVCERE